MAISSKRTSLLHSALVLIGVIISSVDTRDSFERDGVYPGELALPNNWAGVTSTDCKFPSLGRMPSQSHLVRNRLYTLLSPNDYQPGELHIRPTDLVYTINCSPSVRNADYKYITFNESKYSFAFSPTDDISIFTTLNTVGSGTLKLTVIDARDLFVAYKSISVGHLPTNFSQSQLQLSTSFLNARFMLIELSLSNKMTVAHFVYDKINNDVKRVSTLPFSIQNERQFVLDTSSKESIHVIFSNVSASQVRRIMSFRSEPSNAFNFTLEWTHDISATLTDSHVMYHSVLKQVVIISMFTSLTCLDASTGKVIVYQSYRYRGPQRVVSGLQSNFFVAFSSRVEEWIFDQTSSNYSSRTYSLDFGYQYILNIMQISQSGDLYLTISRIWGYNDFTTEIRVIRAENRHQVAMKIDLGVVFKGITPTNYYFLKEGSDGSYSLNRPIIGSPTPQPTPHSYPTPDHHPNTSSSWMDHLWVKLLIIIPAGLIVLAIVVATCMYLACKLRGDKQEIVVTKGCNNTPPDYILLVNSFDPDSTSPRGDGKR